MPPKTITCKNLDVTTVEFTDDDGDTIKFKIAPGGKALTYAVGGQERPPFQQLDWAPRMGTPGLSMPDIRKGFPLPAKGLEDILGGLRCLARKAGIKCNIEPTVKLDSDDFSMAIGGMSDAALGGHPSAAAPYGDHRAMLGLGGMGGGFGGFSPSKAFDGGGAAPGAKPAAKLSKKKIYQKAKEDLTTKPVEIDVPATEPPSKVVKFEDDDEDEVEIYLKGKGKLGYRVAGKELGEFSSVKYDPQMGLPAISFPDTGKGITLQAADAANVQRVIGGIRFLAQQPEAAEFDCQIPARISLPPEIDYALDKEAADALAQTAERQQPAG